MMTDQLFSYQFSTQDPKNLGMVNVSLVRLRQIESEGPYLVFRGYVAIFLKHFNGKAASHPRKLEPPSIVCFGRIDC